MIEYIKSIEFNIKNWGTSRVIRLLLGIFFAVSAVNETDYFALLIGVVLLYQAIANTGCGFTKSGSCKVEPPKGGLRD